MLLKSKTIINAPIFWAMTRPYPYMSDRTISISTVPAVTVKMLPLKLQYLEI